MPSTYIAKFENGLEIKVKADDYSDAIDAINSHPDYPAFVPHSFDTPMCEVVKVGRGGKRPNAGARKGNVPWNKVYGEPTKVARIPESLDPKSITQMLEELSIFCQIWEAKAGDSSNSKRVRYSKAKELIAELKEILEA